MKVVEDQLFVIIGASGDLTARKLIPALFALYVRKLLPEHFAVLGVSRTAHTTEHYRQSLRKALEGIPEGRAGGDRLDGFMKLIYYLPLETSDPQCYGDLGKRLAELGEQYQTSGNCIFYLATPPVLFGRVAGNLHTAGLTRHPSGWRRIIVEKPFGYDLQSARSINRQLLDCFPEDQIYRIDHYLGKETVQNIMVTRFSNGIFEPLWNRNYVNHVEITSAENLGVENRGGYYDGSGALRDMLQNHLLQLMAMVAMEPPTRISANAIRNETLKVLQSVRPLRLPEVEKQVIRGQYTGSSYRGKQYISYRQEKGVRADSHTETYVAVKLFIDNWRWGQVPFYIRTGKRLPARVTEIVVHFRPTPHKLFCFDEGRFNADNQLVIRIQPDEGLLLKLGMKVPGAGFNVQDVNLDFHYADLVREPLPEAYQRLIVDCMQGDATLFTRGDAIEQSWDIVDPILRAWADNPDIPLHGYPAGTWGPAQADSLIEGESYTWRYPCRNLVDDGLYCEL